MLNEKLFDTRLSPIYLEVLEIDEYPHHSHDEIEIIYLLKGELSIEISLYSIRLTEGNYFVVNAETMHYLKGMTKEDIALVMHIDIRQFKEYYPNIEESIFVCNSDSPGHNYHELEKLRQNILEITKFYYSDSQKKTRELHNLSISLLLILVNNFQNWHIGKTEINVNNVYKDSIFQIQRLRRIIAYIYAHYSEKITLDDLAKLEHVNKYYISRLISTGLKTNFQDFLNGVRAEESLEYLYGTKLNLEEIAEKCGFSSINFFRKTLLDKMGETPSSLRKKNSRKSITTMTPKVSKFTDEEAKKILKAVVKTFDTNSNKGGKVVRHFPLDLNTLPKKEFFDFKLRIAFSNFDDIWVRDSISQLDQLCEFVKSEYVSLDFDLLKTQYDRHGSWNHLNRLLFDLEKLNITPEILYKEESKDLISLESHIFELVGKKPKLEYFDDFTIHKDFTSIIKHVLVEKKDTIYVELSAIFNKYGLKRPALYAVDFLNKLSGYIISRGDDHLFTYSKDQYKILLYNNKVITKDFIVNLTNINTPMVSRVFRIDPTVGNEAALWEESNLSIKLNDDLRWSLENVCAPKTEFGFIKQRSEQDYFIPLEKNELALAVLDL